MSSEPLYRCETCGGSRVAILDWTDPNAGTVVPGESYHEPTAGRYAYAAERSHTWCDDCGEHTVLTYHGPEARRCYDCHTPISGKSHRDCDGQEICGACHRHNLECDAEHPEPEIAADAAARLAALTPTEHPRDDPDRVPYWAALGKP